MLNTWLCFKMHLAYSTDIGKYNDSIFNNLHHVQLSSLSLSGFLDLLLSASNMSSSSLQTYFVICFSDHVWRENYFHPADLSMPLPDFSESFSVSHQENWQLISLLPGVWDASSSVYRFLLSYSNLFRHISVLS